MFVTLFRGGEETGGDDETGRFVPSPLDLSVRAGHGGADDEVVRELARVDEQANEFEDRQREN